MRVYTIGHSTRSTEELIALLREHGIVRLADIRRYPASRRFPHFTREALARALGERRIEYVHLPELGGRRTAAAAGSPNTALRNEQFRAYADHMASGEFRRAVDGLVALEGRTAVMCAEAVPWRCHRNLLSDDLLRRGVEVVHILGRGQARRHEMSAEARIEGDHVVYPAGQSSLPL